MNPNKFGEMPWQPSPEKKETGADVSIRNFWIRHAQKQSGEVSNKEGTGISKSSITQKGAGAAEKLGRGVVAKEHGIKSFVSPSPRTSETAEKIIEGYRTANPTVVLRKERRNFILIGDPPKKFIKSYGARFAKERDKVLAGRNMADLSSDEQEQVAEQAEEIVIKEWLEDPGSEIAESYTPRQAAADFAVLFARRHEKMASKLDNGSKIDLLHVLHKTVTEPFLVSGVLIRKSDEKRITKLEEVGGSLGTLGAWESEIKTDAKGQGEVVIRFRGEQYSIDDQVLEELAKEGLQSKRKNREERIDTRKQ